MIRFMLGLPLKTKLQVALALKVLHLVTRFSLVMWCGRSTKYVGYYETPKGIESCNYFEPIPFLTTALAILPMVPLFFVLTSEDFYEKLADYWEYRHRTNITRFLFWASIITLLSTADGLIGYQANVIWMDDWFYFAMPYVYPVIFTLLAITSFQMIMQKETVVNLYRRRP